MFEFLSGLFDSDFMPHGHCYQWQPDILWLHVGSDTLITLAYYAIPFALLYFVAKRRDLDFKGIFLLFGAFILLCGTTHLLEIWAVWHGTYRLTGAVKLLTGVVSVGTAVALVPLVPKAVALPSPSQLRQINANLQQEIRERKQAQQELDRFFDLSVDLLCIAGLDGYFKRINPSFSRVLGYPEEVLMAHPFLEWVHPDDVPATKQQLGALAQGQPVINFEMRLRNVNEAYRWVSWTAQSSLEEGHLFAVGRDITEQREVQEQIQMQTSLLQRAEELAHLGSWHIDMEAGALKWSDEVYRIYERDRALGPPSLEEAIASYHPEDREHVEQVVQEAITHGKNFDFEWRIVRPDGAVRHVYSRGECVVEEGEVKAVFGVFMDITERKQREAERETLITELETKNAELERFTYTVSHDLKSPLVTIKGFTEMLQYDLKDGNTERVAEDLGYITSATETMQTLLNELLQLSRVGRLVNPPEPVALTEIVEETVGYLAGQIASQNAVVEVAPTMPVVAADRVRLQEVVQNLIENALKFIRPGVVPHVEVGAQTKEEEVVCWVRDNGAGIAEAYKERIFGLFERLDHEVEGTGIGLALVKRIVEIHGGRIWVESEGEGQGSTFYFTLPVQQQEELEHE
ncbi:MAG TPA: PAS domain-containing protein [Rhodothermales bacterium]|nr:PAS domain-containing protein [Rhodothermales bacterium]